MAQLREWHLTIFPALVLLHLLVSPYTKVEESFNIQAIHDFLQYGVPISNASLKIKTLFDHMTYPGAVPRTFIGALIVSSIAQPFGLLTNLHGIQQQVLARAVLGLMTAAALATYTKFVQKAFGHRTAFWYMGLQASQFHLFYYASRSLPNTYAFCLSTVALAAALPNSAPSLAATSKQRLAFYLLTLTTVVFRSELALLMVGQALHLLLKSGGLARQLTLIRTVLIPASMVAMIVGIILTVSIDTYMWQSDEFIWPELSAFLFNIMPSENSLGASEWGILPWHWYFTSAIPRLLLSPGILLLGYGIVATTQSTAILDQLIPSLIYTTLYSVLPHKETRFLFPIVPQLTTSIALTASYLSLRRHWLAKIVTVGLAISAIVVGLLSHGLLLPLSAQSYAGAHALRELHDIQLLSELQDPVTWAGLTEVNVYLCNLALQTGVTRFTEQPSIKHKLRSQSALSPLINSHIHSEAGGNPSQTPLVMPGSPDGRYPALTIYPKASGIPSVGQVSAGSSKVSRWTYDKMPNPPIPGLDSESKLVYMVNASQHNTVETNPSIFWPQFDYLVIEPHQFEALRGSFNIEDHFRSISTVYGLGHARGFRIQHYPDLQQQQEHQSQHRKLWQIEELIKHPERLVHSAMDNNNTDQPDSSPSAKSKDYRQIYKMRDNHMAPSNSLLSDPGTLLYRMYGLNVARLYSFIQSTILQNNLTQGKWIALDTILEPKLIILQKRRETAESATIQEDHESVLVDRKIKTE